MDKQTKKALVIMLVIFGVIAALLGADAWMRHKNKFVHTKHLDDTVITVDGRSVSLRELGYYIYYVETEIDKQARLYNPEDPLDYWNTFFNSGTEGGYISEMALDAVVGGCVCDLIYESMAKENGYVLTKEEESASAERASEIYSSMTDAQRKAIGVTPKIVEEVVKRKQLVTKFAKEYFDDVDFTGYQGYREDLVSYAGAYYLQEVLPAHEVEYEDSILRELRMGRITTGHVAKY